MNSSAEKKPLWYVLSLDDVYNKLRTSPQGLSRTEAARRLAEHGPNELQAVKPVPMWQLLLAQFKNILIIILLVATVLSAFLGHGVEAIAIAVIVLFAVLLGFIQEYRAERALEAMLRVSAPSSRNQRRRRARGCCARSSAGRHHRPARGKQDSRRLAAD